MVRAAECVLGGKNIEPPCAKAGRCWNAKRIPQLRLHQCARSSHMVYCRISRKNRQMLKPQVNWTLPDGSSHRLYADRAIRITGVWTFFNAAGYSQTDASAPLLPSFRTYALAMPEFTEKPAEIEDEIKIGSYRSLRNSQI